GFTALAVMGLVADGALTLATTVRSVLGDALPLIDPAVTVEHLLAHTSGIGDYLDEDELGDINDYVMPVPVHLLAGTAAFLPVLDGFPTKFPPGERFSYCNGGYVVLALVIEAVSESAYHDVVARTVFDRAGLGSTAFLRLDELPGTAALGYLSKPEVGGLRTNVLHLPVLATGDGDTFTTAADMAAFWPALLDGTVLPEAVVSEMVRPRNDVPSESLRYGLGFWLRPDRDTVLLEGCDAGVSFRSVYDPASTLHYTVIANDAHGAWPVKGILDEHLPALAAATT
ncbi:MAG: beta-lactamase family protein, partial [Actinomycetota bacterium]|nr:beta-lactamase family protein [Actinomycetota bacterium]